MLTAELGIVKETKDIRGVRRAAPLRTNALAGV